jgi:hypothetical protein
VPLNDAERYNVAAIKKARPARAAFRLRPQYRECYAVLQ